MGESENEYLLVRTSDGRLIPFVADDERDVAAAKKLAQQNRTPLERISRLELERLASSKYREMAL